MTSKSIHETPGRCRAKVCDLLEYLDADLTPARCRALEQHLTECPCCGTMATNLRKAIALCRSEGRRSLPAAVRSRARQRVADLLARERS
jgi:anti-sigma factor RsiW